MRPKEIKVPDSLWRDPVVSEGAKLVWCYCRAAEPANCEFTYAHLRDATGVCQSSLKYHLDELANRGWLTVRPTGLHATVCLTVVRTIVAHLNLPTELILDDSIPRPAKWIWGVIARANSSFTYQQLKAWTGYSYPTLSKCIAQLYEAGWLVGDSSRVSRKAPLRLQPINPLAERRAAELADLRSGMAQARVPRSGYSLGQFLLARMVKLLLAADCDVFENVEVTGLDNAETGGRMHYDLYIPEFRIAIEFHGPQHDGPTERFSEVEMFRALRRRDVYKYGLSWENGVHLIVVRKENLSFDFLREALTGIARLKDNLDDSWHLYDALEEAAFHYRRHGALR